MDEVLTRRYEALFESYGVGGHGTVLDLKKQIGQHVKTGFLRIDAAFFLLVNADHMVVRALTGAVLEPNGAGTVFINPVLAEDALRNNAIQYLAIIIQDLRDHVVERPVTSHAVLMSLDRTWAQMSQLLSWA
jgi:hypothetical protein